MDSAADKTKGRSGFVVGTDTGGTFTDCVLIDVDGGRSVVAKASSTPEDYGIGVVESTRRAAAKLGLELGEVLAACDAFCHGTTVATNTLITRNGAKVGFLTTAGHEDTLNIGRLMQKSAGRSVAESRQTWDLRNPDPLVPRSMVRGIPERIDYSGKVCAALDEAAVRAAVEELVEQGAEIIAVGLLWAHVNPVHEKRCAELVAEVAPGRWCLTSHQSSRAMGEYERFAATVTSAYLGPRIAGYLHDLGERLRAEGLTGELLVMQSSGGVTTVERAVRRAVTLANSGPAGGVVATRALAAEEKLPNMIAVDAGGTSYDVSVIADGEPETTDISVVASYHVRVPMLDVRSVGAGGGSMAHVAAGGRALAVGPQSAGSVPGPVAFGRGGTVPTVTDADLVLGRMGSENTIGGEIRPDRQAAADAIEALGRSLGKGTIETALGICAVATAHKADLIRRRTIARGFDARDFALVAFGGLGPTHAVDIAEEIGIGTVVVPPNAGVFSAAGIARSDFWHSASRSVKLTAPLDPAELNAALADLHGELAEELDDSADVDLRRSIDLRYVGQVHDVRVELAGGEIDAAACERVRTEFERLYELYYGTGTLLSDWPWEAVTLRLEGRTRREIGTAGAGAPAGARSMGRRSIHFDADAATEAVAYHRDALRPGDEFDGPAVVDSDDTTFILNPGWRATVSEAASIVARPLPGRVSSHQEEVAYA